MRGHIDEIIALGLLQVEKERHRGDDQEGKGEDQRKTGDFPELLYPEEMIERGKDKGAGHKPGHERIHDDLNAPVNILVGIREEFFHRPEFFQDHFYLTSSLRPTK